MKIALDAMGGDHAPENNIAGLALALAESSGVAGYVVVGQPERVTPLLEQHGIAAGPARGGGAGQPGGHDERRLDRRRCAEKGSSIAVASR